MFDSIIYHLRNLQFGSNTMLDWIQALLLFAGLNLLLKIIQVIIIARLKRLTDRTRTDFDDVIIEIFTRIKPPFYILVSLYFAVQMLTVSALVERIIYASFILVAIYEVVQALSRLVDYFIDKYIRAAEENGDVEQAQTMASAAGVFVKVVLWVLGIVLALSNLGLNITSLVASLGIGGIAVALAIQNILGDIFSSFSIYADKPFKLGDFIVVGQDKGTVEKIGLKSTRIRTLQGEQLVISNRELTSARVQNFKKLEKRRASFVIGVAYGTALEKLKSIPDIVTEIIQAEEKAELDRCHFVSFGDSSLNFETVFYFDSPDYGEYMDALQRINFALYERFASVRIEFAFPTQTIHLARA